MCRDGRKMVAGKLVIIAGVLLVLAAGCIRAGAPALNLDNSWGTQRSFAYQGIKLNYYEAGQGPPVLLLHGFGGCAYSWRYLAPGLTATHRVFALDLKGYGRSDKPADGKYALSDQAEIAAAFIRAQDLRDLVIMGHSMGGAVTLMTYFQVRAEDPGRISKLVLIDSAGYSQKLPSFVTLAKIPGLSTVLAKLLSPRFATALVLKKSYYDQDKITEEQIDTYAYYGSLPGAAAAVSQTARQLVPADIEALTAQYKTISVPVLIVWGREDEVVPLKVGEQFKRDIPDSKLVVLPRCGHIPPEEEPGATRKAIMEFLEK
jgi:pimeloyl-ACP methyl ester carboxylesterase